MFKFRLLLLLLLLVPLSSGAVNILGGEIEVGDSSRIIQGVSIVQPNFNFSTINASGAGNWNTVTLGPLNDANSTQFSNNGGTLNLLESWVDSLWCRLTGCTMTGDIVLNDDTVGISNNDSSTRIIFDSNKTQWVQYT